MKYQHRYHAGNFGDVLKHVALVDLLTRLVQKDKPCFYLETHAGRGLYPLDRAATHEAALGALKVLAAEPGSAPLKAWARAVRQFSRDAAGQPVDYPGSPCLAQRLLRPQDRATFYEIAPAEAAALAANLGRDARLHVECGEGLHAMKAILPPRERRGLVLIDPAYEHQEQDLDAALLALRAGLERWSTGIYCLWYPIKEREALGRLRRAATGPGWPPTLAVEMCVYRDDTRVGLNGAGLLILNPPWQLDVSMREWVGELHGLLAVDRAARWSVEWLVPDA
ncbi:MAG TPA: 23S rRNA (adenine(2030)-N(6))-methyltransferase RlmJ [Steroidobacteraceae bacterium]|nr:23S rRNA (adenine(2030)-N(6))-methyltransferase RlmJ [Steroidobacteraceae bacterium]